MPKEANSQAFGLLKSGQLTLFLTTRQEAGRLRRKAKESGFIRYMSNTACIHGHNSERFTRNGGCVECARELHRRERSDAAFRAKEAEKERKRRIRNQEKYVQRDKLWRSDPAHKAIKARVQRDRRARKRLAGGSHTQEEVLEILARQRFKCAYCKKDLRKAKFECDHIVSLASGGGNDRNNLQILCPQCNRRKRSTDPIKFAQRNGLLL